MTGRQPVNLEQKLIVSYRPNLTLVLSWVRLAVSVNVSTDSDVRRLAATHWDRLVTQRANRHLHVLLVSGFTAVGSILHVLMAKQSRVVLIVYNSSGKE